MTGQWGHPRSWRLWRVWCRVAGRRWSGAASDLRPSLARPHPTSSPESGYGQSQGISRVEGAPLLPTLVTRGQSLGPMC